MTARKKKLALTALILLTLAVAWQLARNAFFEEEKQVRQTLREAVQSQFPERARASAAKYGLFPYRDEPMETPGRGDLVLIHGLDDPGRIWQDMAPALDAQGYRLWIMRYPDDQPVHESARLFHRELVRLETAGIRRLAVVAHSMGGLVTRELLTSPALAPPPKRPRVDPLIMLGTPNHGSELARFRLLSEVKDHFSDLINGEFDALGWILDGAGEAGIDLIPGSRFLSELNQRPHPPDTRMIVIAAVMERVEKQKLQSFLDALRIPEHSQAAFDRAVDALRRLSEQLGDGLVTVDSARLDGAEFHLVEGNHMTMVRNLMEGAERTPPAVPLVIDILRQRLPDR